MRAFCPRQIGQSCHMRSTFEENVLHETSVFGNTQNHPPESQKTHNSLKIDYCRKTLSSKDDLIWQLWPIRKVENARTLILLFPYFLQKHDFYNHKIDFTRCFALNPSFSFEGTFSFGAIWDLFLVEHMNGPADSRG